MRPLSEYAVYRCEQATTPRCRCRCQGALHGAKRAGDRPRRAFFERLPKDDPHYIASDNGTTEDQPLQFELEFPE